MGMRLRLLSIIGCRLVVMCCIDVIVVLISCCMFCRCVCMFLLGCVWLGICNCCLMIDRFIFNVVSCCLRLLCSLCVIWVFFFLCMFCRFVDNLCNFLCDCFNVFLVCCCFVMLCSIIVYSLFDVLWICEIDVLIGNFLLLVCSLNSMCWWFICCLDMFVMLNWLMCFVCVVWNCLGMKCDSGVLIVFIVDMLNICLVIGLKIMIVCFLLIVMIVFIDEWMMFIICVLLRMLWLFVLVLVCLCSNVWMSVVNVNDVISLVVSMVLVVCCVLVVFGWLFVE